MVWYIGDAKSPFIASILRDQTEAWSSSSPSIKTTIESGQTTDPSMHDCVSQENNKSSKYRNQVDFLDTQSDTNDGSVLRDQIELSMFALGSASSSCQAINNVLCLLTETHALL